MGLVFIWCMHFIGNTAIVMGNGEPGLQLRYSAPFSIVSAILPVFSIFFALNIVAINTPCRIWFILSVILSGLFIGLAIVGTHYVADLGISNYALSYTRSSIGISVVIACIASIVCMALFFALEEFWIDVLLYRLLCAVILAGAVSGMHFEASKGARYKLIEDRFADSHSDNINIIMAIVLVRRTSV